MERTVNVKIDKDFDEHGDLWITIVKKFSFGDSDILKNHAETHTFRLKVHEYMALYTNIENLLDKRRK